MKPFASASLFSLVNDRYPTLDNNHCLDIIVKNFAIGTTDIPLKYGNRAFAQQVTYSSGIRSRMMISIIL